MTSTQFATVIAMDDAGFIFGAYAITFAVIGALTWKILRRGRQLSDQVDDVDKYWV